METNRGEIKVPRLSFTGAYGSSWILSCGMEKIRSRRKGKQKGVAAKSVTLFRGGTKQRRRYFLGADRDPLSVRRRAKMAARHGAQSSNLDD